VVGFLIRRTGQAIFVLFIVTAATLGLVHLFPGGPVRALLGVRASPPLINYYNNLYGFNKPFYEQYIKWVGQLLHGNLGFSDKLNLSVFQQYATYTADQLPAVIYFPDYYNIMAVNSKLANVGFNPLATILPEYWYFTK